MQLFYPVKMGLGYPGPQLWALLSLASYQYLMPCRLGASPSSPLLRFIQEPNTRAVICQPFPFLFLTRHQPVGLVLSFDLYCSGSYQTVIPLSRHFGGWIWTTSLSYLQSSKSRSSVTLEQLTRKLQEPLAEHFGKMLRRPYFEA